MSSTAQSSTRKGPLDIGDRFLKFEIKGLLGKGGHAWVYHGYDPFLDRHVAIKVIPNPAEPGRDLPRRAQLEARVLCKLQHPNVVHVIDAGATPEGAVYIIMEVLHGRTLREVIHELHPLGVSEVLSLGAQIADGVQAAHEQNAIHRDLKPENVFVLKDNTVKVLDFGIAKFLGYGAATTQKDLLHGTVLYMSPEHLQGFGVTVRSDIYALGTILYEAFIGRPPCMIGVQDPTLNAISYSQINRMPPPLDELTGTVPRFIARAIQRMVAKEPADRFATMAEVAALLRANARRYEEESRGSVVAPRQLWHSAPAAPSPTSAPRLTHATTEPHELAPSSVLPAPAAGGQSGDTAPVSRLASSATSPEPAARAATARAAAHAAPTLLSVPAPPSAPSKAPPASIPPGASSTKPPDAHERGPAPAEGRPSAAPQSNRSAAHARGSAASPPVPPAATRTTTTGAGRGGVLRLIGAAVALGVVTGTVVGVAQGYRRPAPAPSASVDEPIVVVSAAPPTVARPTAAAIATPGITTASAQPPTQVVSAQPLASAIAKPTSQAIGPAAAQPAPTKPVAASTSAPAKTPTKAAGSMPASGLWDMSDLDAPSKPKPAPSATPKPRPKLIFGADDVK